ncbi:MAG: TIGR01777 family oxidoreductase [Flavitalea sp.]
METILISGGTGLIGTALSELLIKKGYQVTILTRKAKGPEKGISYAEWNVNKGVIDRNAIATADHIIHLAGANVAEKRWTEERKQEIVNSRMNAGKLILKGLKEIPNKVKTVISASAIGWYGPDTPGMKRGFIESDPNSNDFLGSTTRQWEESILPVAGLGKRLAILRTGIVLSNKGGAFPEYIKPMKLGVAGIIGGGEQIVSWIHIDDIVRMYVAAIENQNLSGVYNATAPETVTNKALTLAIARHRHKTFIPIHVPEFALQVYLGEMKVEVLKSTTVDDEKIRKAGFKFLFPSLESALNELIS